MREGRLYIPTPGALEASLFLLYKVSVQAGRAACRSLLLPDSPRPTSPFSTPKAGSPRCPSAGQASQSSSSQSLVHVPHGTLTTALRGCPVHLHLQRGEQRLREGKALAQRHPGRRLQGQHRAFVSLQSSPHHVVLPFPKHLLGYH